MRKKELKYIKHRQKRLCMLLKASYIELCNDEYIINGITPLNFRDFLVVHLNYNVEEANKITQIYEKYDNRFSKQRIETVA